MTSRAVWQAAVGSHAPDAESGRGGSVWRSSLEDSASNPVVMVCQMRSQSIVSSPCARLDMRDTWLPSSLAGRGVGRATPLRRAADQRDGAGHRTIRAARTDQCRDPIAPGSLAGTGSTLIRCALTPRRLPAPPRVTATRARARSRASTQPRARCSRHARRKRRWRGPAGCHRSP